jgi:hypothetical protein
MTRKDDGAPAFPVTAGQMVYGAGMTLRDWFAGQVMAGMLANQTMQIKGEEPAEIAIARTSYLVANAMLEARNVE